MILGKPGGDTAADQPRRAGDQDPHSPAPNCQPCKA
jgi:hypothetical protein